MTAVPKRQWPRDTALWSAAGQLRKTLSAQVRRYTLQRVLKGNRPFRVMILIGQKRSGNHVFLNWYMSQCPGVCILFNNVSPTQKPTERRRQEMRVNSGAQKTPATLIFSYEDHSPDTVFSDQLPAFLRDYHSQITDTTLVMVMRDPRNLIASRIQKWPEEFNDPARLDSIRARYIETADTILSPPQTQHGYRLVPVLYNALIASENYRAQLSNMLAVRQGARGLDHVANYGHGSSFDGQDKSGNAHEMDVFSRWKRFKEDARFQQVFDDPEMSRLITAFDRRLEDVHRL